MKTLRSLFCAAAALLAAVPVFAADLKVLSAGALKPLVLAMAPAFERETGHRLVVDGDTAGALARRVQAGEAFDVLIVTRAGIDQLAQAGKVAADSAVSLARIGIGVAVKRGAPMPDVSTLAGFKKALLDARAVAYIDPAAGGSSGIYLAGLFGKLGIADEMARKAVLVPGGLVAQRLVSGDVDLALQQMSELLVVPGAVVAGPIPAEVQNDTVYAGGVSATSRDAAAAKAFLAAMTGPAARAQWDERGMRAP
jgi:molybdate transport system substrate-binding protein